jgi:AGZA family xanthine/uracil permease-like MFS transporter
MRGPFHLDRSGSTFSTEIIAGISSFLAASYIIVVNPAILSQTGMPFSGVLTATVLVSFFSTLMMGLYAHNPILVAPGMGLNAFFTYTAVATLHIPWQEALGAVFWSGIVFLILTLFNIRVYLLRAIPRSLRYAIAGGIGLFICLIGLVNAGFIIHRPATLIGQGHLGPAVLTFLAGLLFTAILIARKVKGAILYGILFTTLCAWPLGRWWGLDGWQVTAGSTPLVTGSGWWARPDFSLLFRLDLVHSLRFAAIPVIFSFMFTDLFDSLSTFVGLAEASGMVDEKGEPRNVQRALMTDAVATTIAGLLGSSPGTAYIESAVGIRAGGRTGLTAVTAALLFLPFLFLSPLLSAVPPLATAPALVLVGSFMLRPVSRIRWDEAEEAIPAFLALVLIPFTYSITQGIIWCFLSWTLIRLGSGKRREITLPVVIIVLLCLLSLVVSAQPAQHSPSQSRPAGQPLTGILGAYGEELTIILEKVEHKKDHLIGGLQFTEGTLNGRHVVVALTGIGKVNAAITTTFLIENFHPSEVLFSGIAGGVDPALSPGDLVIGTRVGYHDYGRLTDTLEQGPTRNPATHQDNPLLFPCNDSLVRIAESVSKGLALETPVEGKPPPRIVSGIIVTGDVFVSSRQATRRMWQQMHAEATDMEGAAVGQTCWQQGIPFIVIRCLSDEADSTASSDLARFYRAAAHNAAGLVLSITAALARLHYI